MPAEGSKRANPSAVRPQSVAKTSARTPAIEEVVHDASSRESAWWRSAAIAGSALALALASLALVWLLAKPLALVIGAIVIASALSPIVSWLEQWMPRAIAVIALYVTLLGIVITAGWFIVPMLIAQAHQFTEQLPDLISRGRVWIDRLDSAGADQIVSAVQGWLDRAASVLVQLPMRIFSSVIEIILVIFMSAYWLISGPAIRRFALSLFPPDRREKASRTLDAMAASMGGFVRATILDGIVIGIVVYIGLRLIGVDFAVILALLAAVGELVPVLGPILASVPAIAVALLDSPSKALIVMIFYFVLQQFESNVLLPNVMRSQADVPPLLSLFAVLAGSALGGLLGAIVALPVAGALRVLVIRVLVPAEQDWVNPNAKPPPP